MSLVSIAPAEAEFFVLVVIAARLFAKPSEYQDISGVANRKLTGMEHSVITYAPFGGLSTIKVDK